VIVVVVSTTHHLTVVSKVLHADNVAKLATLLVYVGVLRQHSEVEGRHCRDLPFVVAMEGRLVDAADRYTTHQVVADPPEHDIFRVDTRSPVHVLRKERQPPILAHVLLNGQPLTLEVDTGAATSLINEETYHTLWRNPPVLEPANETLRSYLGEKIPLLGSTRVTVQYEDQSADVQVLIVQGNRTNLFGRDWLKEIKLNWGSIMRVGT